MYLGIDPSLRSTGAVLLSKDGEFYEGWQIETDKSQSLLSSLDFINTQIQKVGKCNQRITDVAIESPFVGSNKLTAHLLSSVWAVINLQVYSWGPKRIIDIHPGALKKFVTGVTTADKDRMRTYIKKTWAFEHKCEDVVEAYALAHMARCSVQPECYTRAQSETLTHYLRLKVGEVTDEE